MQSSVDILTVNVAGDPGEETEIALVAALHGATVICAQGDHRKLEVPGHFRVAQAGEGDRAVCIFLPDILKGRHSAAALKTPHYRGESMERCACLVELPNGIRVANVFLSGPSEWVDRGDLKMRRTQRVREIGNVLVQWNPDAVVGDFNEAHAQGDSPEYIEWCQSPFQLLKKCGYSHRPRPAGTGRIYYKEKAWTSQLLSVEDFPAEVFELPAKHSMLIGSLLSAGVYYTLPRPFFSAEKQVLSTRPEMALHFAIKHQQAQVGTVKGLHAGLMRSLGQKTGARTGEYIHSGPLDIASKYTFVADSADLEWVLENDINSVMSAPPHRHWDFLGLGALAPSSVAKHDTETTRRSLRDIHHSLKASTEDTRKGKKASSIVNNPDARATLGHAV
jgi:hypothetical protein